MAKAGILQSKTVWANAAKIPPEACFKMCGKLEALAQDTLNQLRWECVLSLKSFLYSSVNETGLLTDTSRL